MHGGQGNARGTLPSRISADRAQRALTSPAAFIILICSEFFRIQKPDLSIPEPFEQTMFFCNNLPYQMKL
jgi:hypothetical protein